MFPACGFSVESQDQESRAFSYSDPLGISGAPVDGPVANPRHFGICRVGFSLDDGEPNAAQVVEDRDGQSEWFFRLEVPQTLVERTCLRDACKKTSVKMFLVCRGTKGNQGPRSSQRRGYLDMIEDQTRIDSNSRRATY